MLNPLPLSDPVRPSSGTHQLRNTLPRHDELKMGLRNLLSCSLVVVLLASCAEANSRQEALYQPPLLLPPVQHSPYQPPLSEHDSSRSFSVQRDERSSRVESAGVVHKAPASEIESRKEPVAKEKDAAKDEYVVYYYYYYDNDTSAAGNHNLSLNFDDIPSLEAYDEGKEPFVGNALGNASSASSQARSASSPSQPNDAFIRADKPVSNVFRYGGNEVPRFPVLPHFAVSEVPATTTFGPPTPATSDSPTTLPTAVPRPASVEVEDDAINDVLDSTTDLKETKVAEEETTTTTEPPTTTEVETTTSTTERPTRRRPSIGGRRRFSPSPSPNRGRGSSTSTTIPSSSSAPPTRRSFQGSSRLRPRPSASQGPSRSRSTEAAEDGRRSTTESTSPSTSTTTARSRFSSSAPRRFQSSRSRSQTGSSSTSTTTTTARAPVRSRPQPTNRPRPNLISRNRPPRPGFLRPRPEEVETTTTAEETSPLTHEAIDPSTAEEEEEEESSDEEEEEEEEEPVPTTTTESNRFSALFRPRNRSGGNRPRPVIGNRPARS